VLGIYSINFDLNSSDVVLNSRTGQLAENVVAVNAFGQFGDLRWNVGNVAELVLRVGLKTTISC
jgi:hypothetical protein